MPGDRDLMLPDQGSSVWIMWTWFDEQPEWEELAAIDLVAFKEFLDSGVIGDFLVL
jgi:hypothetical protein